MNLILVFIRMVSYMAKQTTYLKTGPYDLQSASFLCDKTCKNSDCNLITSLTVWYQTHAGIHVRIFLTIKLFKANLNLRWIKINGGLKQWLRWPNDGLYLIRYDLQRKAYKSQENIPMNSSESIHA